VDNVNVKRSVKLYFFACLQHKKPFGDRRSPDPLAELTALQYPYSCMISGIGYGREGRRGRRVNVGKGTVEWVKVVRKWG